jgi:hypothetical protein
MSHVLALPVQGNASPAWLRRMGTAQQCILLCTWLFSGSSTCQYP